MKRMIALLLTLLALTGLLTACGECSHEYDNATDYLCNDCNYNRFVGTWTTTIEGAPGEMTLNADGTGQIISHEITRDCTWVVENNTLSVVQEANGFYFEFLKQVSFELENETSLLVTSQSGNQLVFTKK